MAHDKKEEGTTRVAVYVTGFGPFGPIRVNPSATIAKQVARHMEQPGHGKGAPHIVHVEYEELETSIAAVTAYFARLETKLQQLLSEDAEVRVLLFHIGVHSRETQGVLRLELRGYNELFASIPDVNGVVLDHEPIVADEPAGTAHFLESRIGRPDTPLLTQVEHIIAELDARSATSHAATHEKGHAADMPPSLPVSIDTNDKKMHMPQFQRAHWQLSRDAGRYICNCTLYKALRLQETHAGRVTAVFVHVVDPTKGVEAEGDGGSIERYNPTLMTQTEQVTRLVYALLTLV